MQIRCCLVDKRFMDLGIHLDQNLKLSQAESCLTCENGSLGEGAFPCLQERGGCVEIPVLTPGATQVSPTSFPRG